MSRIARVALCTLLIFSASLSLADTRIYRFNYIQSDWNKNSSKLDSGVIVLRLGPTGPLMTVRMEETGPDTSTFTWQMTFDDRQFNAPEIYVPPQGSVKNDLALVKSMIEQKELKRKPYLVVRDEKGQHRVEIFETREQVETALEGYRNQIRLAQAQAKLRFEDQPSYLDAKDAAVLQERREKQKLAREGAAREIERLKSEQKERQRLERLSQNFRALSEAQQNSRRAQAKQSAETAMQAFQAGDFVTAEREFRKALELDPTDRRFYFQYGVALYKAEKYNDSIVYLRMANDGSIRSAERKYYLGLNYVKLKEGDRAIQAFRETKLEKDPDISPSGAFYEGVVLFEDRQYESARGPFQECLDTSKDPRLDESAEAYIEQIARILAFEEERAKRFILTGSAGVQYDSNVLLLTDANRAGQPSDTEGERYNLSLGLEWRHLYERSYELASRYYASTQYSLLGTEENVTLKKADASVLGAALPFRYKTILFGKGSKLEVSPGYEQIMMGIEKDRDTVILQSALLKLSSMMVIHDNWFSLLSFDVRKDNSLLDSSVGDNDASAMKYTLGWSNYWKVGADKSQTLNLDLGTSLNSAEGRNSYYRRYDVGTGYRRPLPWELSWNSSFAYYQLKYTDATTPRTENNYTLGTGLSRPINAWLQAVSNVAYTRNESDAHDRRYNKFTALLSLSAATSF